MKFRKRWRRMVVAAAVVLLLITAWGRWWPMPALFSAPRSTVMVDRNGILLGASVAADGQWRFPTEEPVPPRFAASIIAFEDRHFRRHPGVYPPSIYRAWQENRKAGRVVRGASTITMQVARLHLGPGPRTWGRKLREVVLAFRLELRYDKDHILALFAANAPFGGNVVGLDAASWRWFGRSPAELGWAEAATLAVLPNAPGRIYPGRGHADLKRKRDQLLGRLLLEGHLDSLDLSLAVEEPLPGVPLAMPMHAPHLLQTLRTSGLEGQRIRTTIDLEVQQAALRSLQRRAPVLRANEVNNAALLVLDAPSGEVLAYVGNLPDAGPQHAGMVDIVHADRSTGSLLKPFLHAAMLDRGELLPDMLVADLPTRFAGFAPANFEGRHAGAVPASEALWRSLNVPAVRHLHAFGTDRALRILRRMGLKRLHHGAEHYGLSLIVGGAESNLWELVGAYASLGRHLLPVDRELVVHPPVVVFAESGEPFAAGSATEAPFDAAAVHCTLEALRYTRPPEGDAAWGRSGRSPFAWKTGTSHGHRDGWAIGADDRHCIGVWTGNANGEGRPGLTGTLAAAPILFDLFAQLPAGAGFDVPHDAFVSTDICPDSGHRASIDCPSPETRHIPAAGMRTDPCPYHRTVHLRGDSLTTWFVLPPAMAHYRQAMDPSYRPLPAHAVEGHVEPMELISPLAGTRLILPLELDGSRGQAVFIAAHRDPDATVHWHLDSTYVTSTRRDHQLTIAPEPGAHLLTLTDHDGRSLHHPFSVVRSSDRTVDR